MPDHHHEKARHAVMRRKRTAAHLDISLATLDRIRANPANAFPDAVRLSEQAIGWLTSDIDAWLATRERVSH